jgi:hypothetical protein
VAYCCGATVDWARFGLGGVGTYESPHSGFRDSGRPSARTFVRLCRRLAVWQAINSSRCLASDVLGCAPRSFRR